MSALPENRLQRRTTRCDPASVEVAAGQASVRATRTRLSSGSAVCGHSLSQPQLSTSPSILDLSRTTTAPHWDFSRASETPRTSLYNKQRLDPSKLDLPAGSRSSRSAVQQNHFSSGSDSKPCRAPLRHFEPERRLKSSSSLPPPMRTDPISFSHLGSGAGALDRSVQRLGYHEPCATSTWSVAAKAPEPSLSRTAVIDAVGTEASLRRSQSADRLFLPRKAISRVCSSPRGGAHCHVAGAEDLLPGGTRKFAAWEEPPDSQTVRMNDRKALPLYERMACNVQGAAPSPRIEPESPRVADCLSVWSPGAGSLSATPRSSGYNLSLHSSKDMQHCMKPEAIGAKTATKPLRLFRDPLRSGGRLSPTSLRSPGSTCIQTAGRFKFVSQAQRA
mmetsp:Transcript_71295/g.125990  ORF Transcript_71295/g.125990 Transcript_71295/m.125990 type:complete len:390 (+) Transcript_71295:50-1219(+)